MLRLQLCTKLKLPNYFIKVLYHFIFLIMNENSSCFSSGPEIDVVIVLDLMVLKNVLWCLTFVLIYISLIHIMGFPGGSVIKNPPPMQQMWVWPLGKKYPLEKEMAIHCSILAWEIPWTEEPDGLLSMRLQKSWANLATKQQQLGFTFENGDSEVQLKKNKRGQRNMIPRRLG